MLGVSQSRGLKLFGREIIFEEFQPMCCWYLNVTDGRTDGQTDGRLTVASPRSALASRGKKQTATPYRFLRQMHPHSRGISTLLYYITGSCIMSHCELSAQIKETWAYWLLQCNWIDFTVSAGISCFCHSLSFPADHCHYRWCPAE